MAIVIGNKTGSQLNPSGSTQTLSHNMSTGADGALLVCVTANNSSGKTIGSCSYGGQAMTTSSTLNAGSFAQQQKYFILNNPPTGSNNIVVTYSGGSQFNKTSIFAVSLTGVASPASTTNGKLASNATPNDLTATGIADNSYIFTSGIANVAPVAYTINGVGNLPFQFNHNINKRVGGAELLLTGPGTGFLTIGISTACSSGSLSNHYIEILASGSTPPSTNTGNFLLCM